MESVLYWLLRDCRCFVKCAAKQRIIKLRCAGCRGICQYYWKHWAIRMCYLLHRHWSRMRRRASRLPTHVLPVCFQLFIALKFHWLSYMLVLVPLDWVPGWPPALT